MIQFFLAVIIGLFAVSAPAHAAPCDSAGLQACTQWAYGKIEAAGCHPPREQFDNAVSDLYFKKGCRLNGTQWYNVETGTGVKGSFSGGINVDTAGCIARYTPTSYLHQGGYLRTPTEAINGPLYNKSLSGCELNDASSLTKPIRDAIESCSCAGQVSPKPAPAVVSPTRPATPSVPQHNGTTPSNNDPCVTMYGADAHVRSATHSGSPEEWEIHPGLVKPGQNVCVCDNGYQRSGSVNGKPSCVDITNGQLGIDGDSMSDVIDAINKLRKFNVEIGASDVVSVETTNHKKLSIGLLKTGTDSYLYTPDGIHYYDSLEEALKKLTPSFIERLGIELRNVLYYLSPFNWVSKTSKDEKEISQINEQLVAENLINATPDHPVNDANSIKYQKEYLAGAYEYIQERQKGVTLNDLVHSNNDADVLIEQATQRLRTSAVTGSVFEQQTGQRRTLTDKEKEEQSQKQKIELYSRYEQIYVRYELTQKLHK